MPKRNRISRKGTIARAYGTAGRYWRDDVIFAEAGYFDRCDLVLTACHFDERVHEGDYYSDFTEPMLEEVRILAALTLCLDPGEGMTVFYPLDVSIRTPRFIDLTKADQINRLADLLRGMITERMLTKSLDGEFSDSYQYHGLSTPFGLQHQIYAATSVSDHLLMRGLSMLINSAMLSRHRMFGEAAYHALYIALDASLALVQRQMRKIGLTQTDAHAAQAYLEQIFGDELSGFRYFEEYYEDRIMVLHPASRFGTFPYAPVSRSHYFWLWKSLRDVYRFLILQKVVRSADLIGG